MPTVSIVVPVYNSEDYLEVCIASLLNQTFQDIEIILINDGSTDRSLDIIYAFAENDQRIRIHTQKNQGVSAARNAGLSMANGDYILCVDSDDAIELDTIETLYHHAIETDAEIVMGNALIEYANGQQYPFLPRDKALRSVFLQTGEWCFNKLMQTYAPPLVYLFFIKRDFVITNQLFFKEGIVHEDDIWCTKTMLLTEKMSLLDFTYYHYIQREGSIMHSNNKLYRVESYAVVVKELLDFVESNHFSTETMGSVYAKIFVIFHSLCQLLQQVKKNRKLSYLFFKLTDKGVSNSHLCPTKLLFGLLLQSLNYMYEYPEEYGFEG
jgi:glycosyltransferase involved in cell wall biosynthesis